MNKKSLLAVSGFALLVTLGFNNCAGPNGTSTGNPNSATLAVRIDSYNSSLNQKVDLQPMSLGYLKMCIKRLRFKPAGGSASLSNVDLSLGEIDISPAGTDVIEVNVPAGTYERVEFTVDDHCGAGRSVAVQNAQGTFATDEGMTIRFDGNFTVTGETQSLVLNIQAIAIAMNAVTNNNEIRNRAEAASGSF